MKKSSYIAKFLIWREHKIKDTTFVLVLCIIIGLFAALAAVILKTSVHYIEQFLRNTTSINNQNWLFLALPFVGIFITILYIKYFVKDDISHGVSKVLYSISKNKSIIKFHNVYSSMIACTLTSGFGGSVGMEAPIISTGSAIGSNIGKSFHMNQKTRTLLIGCGAAAAMSAIFKAPIAGMIFALEVLMLDLTTASIIPLLISAATAITISSLLLGKQIEFYFSLRDPFDFTNIPLYVVLGIITGLISLYFTIVNAKIDKQFKKISNPINKVFVGGIILGVLIFFFPPLFGEGYMAMKATLTLNTHELLNNSMFYYLNDNGWWFILYLVLIILFKAIATSITTNSGGIGGVFAPSLFLGGISGIAFAKCINLIGFHKVSEGNFSLVGMSGILAGVMHAPLTAIFLIAEITGGYELFIPLIITASISYLTINYFEPHSIYTKKLAEKGELITHNKDNAVLTMLSVKKVVETNFNTVYPENTLGDLVKIIAKSKRNIFPVVDNNNIFLGLVPLDDVREIMFEKDRYDKILMKDIMVQPPVYVYITDKMDVVMKKFKDTGLWNLPVTDNGKYIGFVSRANVFNVYRKVMIEFSDE